MRLEKINNNDFTTQHFLDDLKDDHLPEALRILQELQIKLSGNKMTSANFEIALSNEIHRLKYLDLKE